MIQNIQNSIQKHHRVVFFILLTVIIVAFVFTIGAAPGLGPDGRRTERREFFGYNLASERDLMEIAFNGRISYRLQHGDRPPRGDDEFNNFITERVAFIELANRLNIPPPSHAQEQEFIRGLALFHDESGRFSLERYQTFIDEIDVDPRIDIGRVALVLADDFRAHRARELIGGPGFFLPAEALMQVEEQHTRFDLVLGSFDIAAFQPEIEIDEEELRAFFDENQLRYQRPQRVRFSYAEFRPENYRDQVEVTEERLREYFQLNLARFTPPPAEPQPQSEPNAPADPDAAVVEEGAVTPEISFEQVRNEVEAAFRDDRSRRLASLAAADFAFEVFNRGIRPQTPEFEQLLREFRTELRDAPPVAQNEFPPELGFPVVAQQQVFRLGPENYFSDVVQVGDRALVLVYQGSIPTEIPELEEVRDRVLQDYQQQERRRLLVERTGEIWQSIIDRMAGGQSFVDAAREEGLNVVEPAQFTRQNPPFNEVPWPIFQRLGDFTKGNVSRMIEAGNNGHFVYMREIEIPQITADGEEAVTMATNMRNWTTVLSRRAFIQEFIQRETQM